jgi:hypothetical protein
MRRTAGKSPHYSFSVSQQKSAFGNYKTTLESIARGGLCAAKIAGAIKRVLPWPESSL